MVEINIINESYNKLLKRKEIEFEIDHFGKGSPNRIEVKEKLAAMKTAKADLTLIKKMKPLFGLPQVHGLAYIYDDDEAIKIEPHYIKIRNAPKDQRQNLWKEIKEKKKKKKKKK